MAHGLIGTVKLPQNMAAFPDWRFREMDRGEINVDPVHDEFFKAQDLPDALVRETIQNSLDARRGRATVRVRYRFASGDAALSPGVAARYLGGLGPHLEAVSRDLQPPPPRVGSATPPRSRGARVPAGDDATQAMTFLVIEDSGTRGLGGDPAIDPELDDAPNATDDGAAPGDQRRNDFYFFWHNVGRSSKGEHDRGRWGLGKAVFPVASRIRTMFGLTRRAEDGRLLLMGQSVLKTHVIDGHRFYPYGFFGRFERSFPIPIEDPELIETFARDFLLQREEPGLSIVVPFPREADLALDAIVRSAVQQYFYPITRGDLVVTVEDGTRSEVINNRTIDGIAMRTGGEPMARLCALARWYATEAFIDSTPLAAGATSVTLRTEASNPDSSPVPPATAVEQPESSQREEAFQGADARTAPSSAVPPGAPRWSDDVIPAPLLASLRQQFDAGERIAIRVPVAVKRKRSRPAAAHFDVVLEKDATLRRGQHHFIRRGITIPDVRSGRDKPVRALLIADDDALATLLGDAENPAHSDWSERADKVRSVYDHGPSTVRFVKNSITFLASLLGRAPEGRSRDFLAEFFSVDASAGTFEGTRGAAAGARGVRKDGPPIPARAEPARNPAIERAADGVSIRGSGDPRDIGVLFVAELAYRTRSGNPFSRYSPFDFVLGEQNVLIKADGATAKPVEGNRIEIVPHEPGFRVAIHGFDPRRDLVVRMTRRGNEAGDSDTLTIEAASRVTA